MIELNRRQRTGRGSTLLLTLCVCMALAMSLSGLAQAADQSQAVYCVRFSPDGKKILSGGASRKIQLWDAETGRELKSFFHPGWVHTVAFSPNGRLCLSGARDRIMRLWDIETGNELKQFRHRAWVSCALFSPDGKTCFSVGGDDMDKGEAAIRLWDVETGREIRKFEMPPKKPGKWGNTLTWASLSRNGKLLVTSGTDIIVWNVETGKPLRQLPGHQELGWEAVFSSDAKLCLAAGNDKNVRVWNLDDGKLLKTIAENVEVRALAVSPDGNLSATGGLDGRIRIHNLQTFQLTRLINAHKWIVESLDFSSDGAKLVSGSFDGTIKLWDAKTWQPIRFAAAQAETDDPTTQQTKSDRQSLAEAEKRIEGVYQRLVAARKRASSDRGDKGRVIGFAIDGKTGAVPQGLEIVGTKDGKTLTATWEQLPQLNGMYELTVDPGVWKLEVRADGYKSAVIDAVIVGPGNRSGMGVWRVIRLEKK